jgi:hypothetical protein
LGISFVGEVGEEMRGSSVIYIAVATSVFAGASLVFFRDNPQAPVELDGEPTTEGVVATKSDRLTGIVTLLADKVVRIERYFAPGNPSSDLDARKRISDLVHFYVYSEVPPEVKPADMALTSLEDVPVGTPVEEVSRASNAFGLDFNFMKAVAKIESDFDPKQRTGSYIGLFQLSTSEFSKYGSGDILNPRDNAIAAAFKFATSALMFELTTHKKPTISDLYLIHQQGTQGAEEHVTHPERIAWKSMCATDEGREKGENWCKRAVWNNTLPEVKQAWKSVDNLTSGAFIRMWETRIDGLYARYSEAVTN